MKLDFPEKQRSFQAMPHGGKRPGSGRKAKNPKTILARIDKVTAATILAQIDENQVWLRHIKSEDARISLDALKFLTLMRDGKPRQPIPDHGAPLIQPPVTWHIVDSPMPESK